MKFHSFSENLINVEENSDMVDYGYGRYWPWSILAMVNTGLGYTGHSQYRPWLYWPWSILVILAMVNTVPIPGTLHHVPPRTRYPLPRHPPPSTRTRTHHRAHRYPYTQWSTTSSPGFFWFELQRLY